jgi:prevent-host-death family protein
MSIRVGSRELTVTEASQRGVAGLISDAEQGADVVVTRHRRPVAVVVAYHRLEELAQAAEDLRDLALVLARSADDVGKRTSLDDVLRAFGHDRESLAALPDDE